MTRSVACANCSAPVPVTTDARLISCAYCGSTLQIEATADGAISAVLRQDLGAIKAHSERAATASEAAAKASERTASEIARAAQVNERVAMELAIQRLATEVADAEREHATARAEYEFAKSPEPPKHDKPGGFVAGFMEGMNAANEQKAWTKGAAKRIALAQQRVDEGAAKVASLKDEIGRLREALSPRPVRTAAPRVTGVSPPPPRSQARGARAPLVGCLVFLCVFSVIFLNRQADRQAKAQAEAAFELGKRAFDEQRWAQAYPLLEQAARIKADDPTIRRMIAEARQHHREAHVADAAKAETAGDLDRAVELLGQANDVSPAPEIVEKLQSAKYAAGKKALDEKRFDRAYELLLSIATYKDAGSLADNAKREKDYTEASSFVSEAEEAAKSDKPEDALSLLDQAASRAAQLPNNGKPSSIKGRIEALRTSVLNKLYDQANATVEVGELERGLGIFRRLGAYRDASARAIELEQRLVRKKAEAELAAVETSIKAGELERAETALANLARKHGEDEARPEVAERSRALGKAWEKAWTASLTPMDGSLARSAGALLQENVRETVLSKLPTDYTPLQRKNYLDTAEGREELAQRTREHDAAVAALLGKRYVMRWRGLSAYDLKKGGFNVDLGMYGGAFGRAVAQRHEAADFHRSVVNGVWFTNATGFLVPVARKNKSDAGKWLRLRCDEKAASTIEPARNRVEVELTFRLARDTKVVAGPGSPSMVCPVAVSERVRLIDPAAEDPTRRVLLSFMPHAQVAKAVRPAVDDVGGDDDDDDE